MRFIHACGIRNSDGIGSKWFIEKVNAYAHGKSIEDMALTLASPVPTVTAILTALQQTSDYDIRRETRSQNLFFSAMNDIRDLKRGAKLKGKVMNVVEFGAFVDIGVGVHGLLSVRSFPSGEGDREISLGDVVEVVVENFEIPHNRIDLTFVRYVDETD
jgi:uncharacterized protein